MGESRQDVSVAEDQTSLMSTRSLKPSPNTLTKIVNRLRALTMKLLPLQVDINELSTATSRIITPKVIDAYIKSAGDFTEALPYCLLRARQTFVWDANHNVADYDENMGRAIACEILARRVVHKTPEERLSSVMSTRFRHRDWDGDDSSPASALEAAIDQHCTIFLSSNEAQHVVNQLWRGDWIQKNNEDQDIDYVPYKKVRPALVYPDPSRLGVPRYQNVFRIVVWLFFLFVYFQAVQEPLSKLTRSPFDKWEGILYVFTLAFSFEDLHKLYATIRYFTWRAFDFWTVISLTIDSLLVAAFILRVMGVLWPESDQADLWHLRSFQLLSCVSPFIWMKVITVFDGFKYIGTMQICVSRMLKESAIFFVLLSILGIGFAQGLYALDASDGETDRGFDIVNTLLQALLQSPNFEMHAQNPFGLMLYYLWNVATTLVLLNVLISLFSSAYSDVVDNAEAQFLAFFAGKTISMIRAPDSFVYPPPFNLIEAFFVAPLQPFLTQKAYEQVNQVVMSVLFFIPLTAFELFELHLDTKKNLRMRMWFEATEDGQEDDPTCQNPEADGEDGIISKVAFAELMQALPKTDQSAEATLMHELHVLRQELDNLSKRLEKSL